MEYTSLTAEAIHKEISTIVAEVTADLPFSEGIDYDFLEYMSLKAMQIFWQEYALQCGATAYAEWKNAQELNDLIELGNWCVAHMNDEEDASVFTRVAAAFSVVRTEMLQKIEQEYSDYTHFLAQQS